MLDEVRYLFLHPLKGGGGALLAYVHLDACICLPKLQKGSKRPKTLQKHPLIHHKKAQQLTRLKGRKCYPNFGKME